MAKGDKIDSNEKSVIETLQKQVERLEGEVKKLKEFQGKNAVDSEQMSSSSSGVNFSLDDPHFKALSKKYKSFSNNNITNETQARLENDDYPTKEEDIKKEDKESRESFEEFLDEYENSFLKTQVVSK